MAYSYKGSISFGFVYIPITLHASTQEHGISFHLLDKKTRKLKMKTLSKGMNMKKGNMFYLMMMILKKLNQSKKKALLSNSLSI